MADNRASVSHRHELAATNTLPALEALNYVYSFSGIFRHSRNGRERSERFLKIVEGSGAVLGPGTTRITGTNGKGTTTRYVERNLIENGYRTVCLTSPHTYTVRERIRLDGEIISWDQMNRALHEISPFLEQMRGSDWHPRPTDIWTWIAFWIHSTSYLGSHGVYEVSRGGATDVVNVFRNGVVGLTNIGTDHLDLFGTRNGLLLEKLGLAHSGDILCFGGLEHSLTDAIVEYCEARDIITYTLSVSRDDIFDFSQWIDLEGFLNWKLSESIAKALQVDCAEFSECPLLPARIENRDIAGKNLLLDGAHNIEAMRRLASRLSAFPLKTRAIIFGVQVSKDWQGLIRLLGRVPGLSILICVETTTGQPRDGGTLSSFARSIGIASVALKGMLSGLEYALTLDWDECVVTGSFRLFRDFELSLHELGYGSYAVPLSSIDPQQPWMRELV